MKDPVDTARVLYAGLSKEVFSCRKEGVVSVRNLTVDYG